MSTPRPLLPLLLLATGACLETPTYRDSGEDGGGPTAEGEGEGEGPAEGEGEGPGEGEGEGPAEGEGEGEDCPLGEVFEDDRCRVVFREVAASRKYACGLRLGGTIECWGDERDGRTDPAEGTFEHVSIGADHGCAIDDQGRIQCWGLDMQGDRGHSVEGVPDSQFLVLAVATNTTCAIAPGGYVDCWGSNYQGQADIEGEGPFEELVAGGQNFCGIRADRTARCWGYNAWEGDERAWKMLGIDEVLCGIQVGTETVECFENRDGEAREAPDGTFEQVSVGRLFACGVTTDRAVECWRAEEGPVQAPFPAKNHDLVSVSVGYDHACALRSSGTLYCWGVNDKGQTDAP